MSDWEWYPKSAPRRVANGIKSQIPRGGYDRTWWTKKWIEAIERLVDAGRLERGRSYARTGQVLNIDIAPGRVDSRVQGSRSRPYAVLIEIEPLSEIEWKCVANAMATKAIFAAKLLSGEMPQNIEDAFEAAKVSLFPKYSKDLKTDCSCPDWSNPCKHIAAVTYLIGEQFESDPFLLFRLRGKSKEEIINMLRMRRTSSELVSPPPRRRERKPKAPVYRVEPLEQCLDRFWDSSDSFDDFEVKLEPPPVDAVPIKRLGAPGFWRDNRTDLLTLFSTGYKAVTQASLNAALGSRDDQADNHSQQSRASNRKPRSN